VRKLLTVAVVGAVVAIGVAAAVEALRASSPEEGSQTGTTSAVTTTAETSATAVTAPTVTQESPVPITPEPVTVTALADIPTMTEKGTNVLPKSAPAWRRELSVCKAHTFVLVYDRDRPAILVRNGDEVIAWAGVSRRAASDECRGVPRKRPVVSSELPPEGIYESVEVHCTAPGNILVDVHPIEFQDGSVYGSIVAVELAGDSSVPRLGTTDWLVSAIAVSDTEGRRVYLNEKYCVRS
jgi:hypothetical protein